MERRPGSEIAKLVSPDPRVRYVEFRSFDSNYWSSWDLGSVMHPQTLLAYGMNGHDLPVIMVHRCASTPPSSSATRWSNISLK